LLPKHVTLNDTADYLLIRENMMVFQHKSDLTILLRLLVLTGMLLGSLPSFAQEETQSEEASSSQDTEQSDPYGRDTPRGSFVGFLKAAEEFDFEKAAEYLDLRNLPHEVSQIDGATLAEQLDFVIKRKLPIEKLILSNRNDGQAIDDLPEYRDELGRIQTVEGELVLLLQKVPGPETGFLWKVSNATVAIIPALYKESSYPAWVDTVRSKLPADKQFLGLELFKWVILLAIAILTTPIVWLILVGLSRVITKPTSPLRNDVRKLLARPVLALIIAAIFNLMLENLGMGATARKIQQAGTLVTIMYVWFLFSVIDLARASRREKYLAQGRNDAAVLGRPMANALKLLTILAALLVWLTNAGIDITTLLAGLGIGGIAIALALQKPIEDLLGAISIYSQQPVVTGDLCKVGDVFGQVEEIGLRTTHIRTLSDTRVSIPNSTIAYGEIENYAVRKKMLYHPDLPLRYDTTPEQMQAITSGIVAMLGTQKNIIQESARVRFTEFDKHSMIVKVRIYVDTEDFNKYLEVVEWVNFEIMKIVQDSGAHFDQGFHLEST
jgi:MscS family membrane protein